MSLKAAQSKQVLRNNIRDMLAAGQKKPTVTAERRKGKKK